jgi:hypothetical protein
MTIPWREKARLRPRDLAEVASVSLRTIWRKIKAGEIESFSEGRARFIPIRAALEFVGEAGNPTDSAEIAHSSDAARAFVTRIRSGVA